MKPDFSYKVTQKVKKYIIDNKLIEHGDYVVVGLSGGADSVCLFLFLNKLKEELGFKLFAIHVHHGIRGESALSDETFSRNLCEKYSVPYSAYFVNVPELAEDSGLTVEEAGRNARYAIFEKYAKDLIKEKSEVEASNKKIIVKIAVAHHINDQAETVIFNMIRGSGLKGIGGMSPLNNRKTVEWNGESDKIAVIRPLLCLTRAQIEDYLEANNQTYCLDETNEDNDYSRNLIRNEVIKELESIQPKTTEHIAYMAEEIREAIEYMDSEVEKLFKEAVTEITEGYALDVTILKDKSKIIVRQLIIYVLKQLISNYKDITRNHIEDIYGLFEKGKGKYVTLPYNLIARKERGCVIISKNES